MPLFPDRPPTGDLRVPAPDGRTTFVFDNAGRHKETRDALTDAVVLTVGRDLEHRVMSVTATNVGATGTPIQSPTSIVRDGSGKPLKIVGPYLQETQLELDAQTGYLSRIVYPVDSDGDSFNDEVQLTHTVDGLLTAMLDARGNNHVFVYDALGRLTEDHEPSGGTQFLSRSSSQPTDGYTIEHKDAAGHVTTFTVEPLAVGGWRRTIVAPDGTAAVSEALASGVTTTLYADGTKVESSTASDPLLGPVAAFNATEKTTIGSGAGQLIREIERVRTTPGGGVTWREVTTLDPGGINAVTKIEFSSTNSTRATTTPELRTIVEELDAASRVRKVSRPGAGIFEIVNEYDQHGRLSAVTQGTRSQTFTYHTTSDPKKGYLASHVMDVSPTATQTTTYVPDALGRALEQTIGSGQSLATTEFGWDAHGNLSRVKPPGQPDHNFSYTPLDLLEAYTPPQVGSGNVTTTYGHALDRDPQTEYRPDGLLLTRTYDSQSGKLLGISQPGHGDLGYHYYTLTGQLEKITGPGGVDLKFEYVGRLPSMTIWSGEVSGSVGFGYNDVFWKTEQNVTVGTNTYNAVFGYDHDGLLTCASPTTCPSGTNALTLAYDAPPAEKNGLLYTVTTGSGGDLLRETFTYNAYGEVADQLIERGASSPTTIAEFVYDTTQDPRDLLGRIVKKTETLDSQTTTWTYAYDDHGRLDVVTKNGQPFADYEYDLNGNRLSVDGPQATTAIYDVHDRMLTHADATYTYGQNGELRTKTVGSATTTYTYDGFGNLRFVHLPDSDVIEYVVDGLARRVGKRKNGNWVKKWLYKDQLNPVAEVSATGDVTHFVYASRAHVPDLMIKNGIAYRLIVDQLGSVRIVVRLDNGAVVQRITYDPWGNPIAVDGGWEVQSFGFAGGLYDDEVGFVRFGARDYDPTTGRWTAKDPIRFDGDQANLYEYIRSDPVNRFDIFGLGPVCVACRAWFDKRWLECKLDCETLFPTPPYPVNYVRTCKRTLCDINYYQSSWFCMSVCVQEELVDACFSLIP